MGFPNSKKISSLVVGEDFLTVKTHGITSTQSCFCVQGYNNHVLYAGIWSGKIDHRSDEIQFDVEAICFVSQTSQCSACMTTFVQSSACGPTTDLFIRHNAIHEFILFKSHAHLMLFSKIVLFVGPGIMSRR